MGFLNSLLDVAKKAVGEAIRQSQEQANQQSRPQASPAPAQPSYASSQPAVTDWNAYFAEILRTEFPQYGVAENVPVTDLAGYATDMAKLYKKRPMQAYKAEWGAPYTFVLYANGGPAGDLIVFITVRPHKLFKRNGTTLLLDMPISFTQAALGADIDVPTLDGTVKYHIPEGTQSETEFRIRGQGLPRVGSSLKGDLVVHVKVEVPKRMSEKQKDLLRQFEEASSGKEYEGRKSFLDKVKDLFNG